MVYECKNKNVENFIVTGDSWTFGSEIINPNLDRNIGGYAGKVILNIENLVYFQHFYQKV